MKEITATGQSVDVAIESALSQLNATKDQVDIKIIDEGKKGLFGIFGARPAVIKAKLKIDPIEEAKNYLINVCKQMGTEVDVIVQQDGKYVSFKLSSDKTGLIIGKRGQTLNALQHLTQLVLNRYAEQYLVLELDIEDYRQRRKESLESLANRVARQVMRSQKEVKLEPMPSFERKIIHAALAEHGNVKTYSIGEEPHRRLVVAPK